MYLPQQSHVAPLVTVRRERMLPVPGKVLVRMNQKVAAADVVARGAVSPSYRVLDVSRVLGLPAEQADRAMACKAGQPVSAGDTLAGPVGLLRRRLLAPVDGRVVARGGGQILLEAAVEPVELQAGFPGVVVNLEPDLGVTIETTGALVQAQWGNGRPAGGSGSRRNRSGAQGFGVMRLLSESQDDELTVEKIDVGHRGTVLVAGVCADQNALRLASDLKLRGMILGWLAADLRQQAARLPFPLILIDGFGRSEGSRRCSMNTPAFELLKSNAGREVAVDARPAEHYTGHRPEVVIPVAAAAPATGAAGVAGLPVEGEVLAPGQRVRVLRAPYQGQVGLVVSLSARRRLLPSGVRAFAARVELDEIGSVLVPFANLEILE